MAGPIMPASILVLFSFSFCLTVILCIRLLSSGESHEFVDSPFRPSPFANALHTYVDVQARLQQEMLSQPIYFQTHMVNYSFLPFSVGRPAYTYTLEVRPGSEMPPKPIVSIITPVYNSQVMSIGESILKGSFQQFEWIVINDGSTDPNTLAVLAEWRSNTDSRIRYYDLLANGGLSAARNAGARLAKGSILLFADADDIFEPTYLGG